MPCGMDSAVHWHIGKLAHWTIGINENLLNFFLKYNYWFLFVLLEIISFALLFRFNSYQGSAFFTSANFVSGAMYDAANNVTGYFHLKTINDELVQKNVELELQFGEYP